MHYVAVNTERNHIKHGDNGHDDDDDDDDGDDDNGPDDDDDDDALELSSALRSCQH